jgi:hypothetical protein
MSYLTWTALIGVIVISLTAPAQAVTCANGVYRAGCAGPNGAAVVRKPYAAQPYYRQPYYHRPPATVTCANGVYRAGCAGPNGAAVVRKPPY